MGLETLTGIGLVNMEIESIRVMLPAPPGVPGDYNDNGIVDAADYVLWRNGGPLENEVATTELGHARRLHRMAGPLR